MFRNCFGEFFVRGAVTELFSGPVLADTIVAMSFLLEANEDNEADVDIVWRRQATGQGVLGNYQLTEDNFVIYGNYPRKAIKISSLPH